LRPHDLIEVSQQSLSVAQGVVIFPRQPVSLDHILALILRQIGKDRFADSRTVQVHALAYPTRQAAFAAVQLGDHHRFIGIRIAVGRDASSYKAADIGLASDSRHNKHGGELPSPHS